MSQYPHMEPVDGRHLTGLGDEDSADAARIARAVCERTHTRCFYNVITGKLLFVYGEEPFGGPLQVPFKTADGFRRYDAGACDAMVEYIRLGLKPRAEKDRISVENARRERQEMEKLGQQLRDDVRPDVLSHAAFLDRRRRGTQRTFLCAGSVNGALK